MKPNKQDFNLLTYSNHFTARVLMKAARMRCTDEPVHQREEKDRVFSPKLSLPIHEQVTKASCGHFEMPQRCSLSQYPT